MSTVASTNLTFALVGNPNCGKTTIFNALTGLRQKIGNYPGVTVEKKVGSFFTQHGEKRDLIDLPGTYSLVPQSPDERVTRDTLLGLQPDTPAPDRVICVLDASNLERNLYLATQVLEVGLPTIVVLNMMDMAAARGEKIDLALLSEHLGCPVVAATANHANGLIALRLALSQPVQPNLHPHKDFENLDNVSEAAISARYDQIGIIANGVTTYSDVNADDRTDRIDAVLTHPVWGWVVFLGLMGLMFWSIFTFASYPMDFIDATFSKLSGFIQATMPAGDLRDLLTDGVIAGVGGVLVFLPQILILFLFIGLLEDSGYMARAAFIMDRVMSRVGLHGKSFIPLLSSYACAIPGIMATRTIESPRDRLATILVAPFMSCSARLPVYGLMISTLIPGGGASAGEKAGLMMLMYLLGTAAAFFFALLFKRTFLRGEPPPLVLELPPYRLPGVFTVLQHMLSRAKAFLTRAGTLILGLSILLWFVSTFPKTDAGLSGSFAGRVGHFIEPALIPLGFNWKIGIGLIGAQAAREVFVSTMGIVYSIDGADENTEPLRLALLKDHWPDGRLVFTPLVALCIMVFFVFSMQCIATLAVVKRETNSWRWPAFQFFYMTGFAYLTTLVLYQAGRALGF
ncbi:MAG: ferrous iron transport protein B [Chthoniobacterales bacterium]